MQNGSGVLSEKPDGGIQAALSRDESTSAPAISALAQTLAAPHAASEVSTRRMLSGTPRLAGANPPAPSSASQLSGFPAQQGLGLALITPPGRVIGGGEDAITRASTLASSLRLGAANPSGSPFSPFFAPPHCGGTSLAADALQKQLLQQARVLTSKTALGLEQFGAVVGGGATSMSSPSAPRLAGTSGLAVLTPGAAGGETGGGTASVLSGSVAASQTGAGGFMQPHSAAVQTAVLNGAGLGFLSRHQLLAPQQTAGKTAACIGSVLAPSPLSSPHSSFELATSTSSLHPSHSVDTSTSSLVPSAAKSPDSNRAASVVSAPLPEAATKTLSHPSSLPSSFLGSRSGSGAAAGSESDMLTAGVNPPPVPSSASTPTLPSSLPALRAGSKRGGRGRLHRPVVLSSYKNRHASTPSSTMTAAANRGGGGTQGGGGGGAPGGGHSGSGGGIRGGASGASGEVPEGADITGTAAGTQVHAAATRGSRVHWGRFDALFRRVAVGPFAESVLDTFKTSQERRVAIEEARAIESILGAPPVCPDAKALLHPPLEDQEVVESLLEMYVKEVKAAVKKSREAKRRMGVPSKGKHNRTKFREDKGEENDECRPDNTKDQQGAQRGEAENTSGGAEADEPEAGLSQESRKSDSGEGLRQEEKACGGVSSAVFSSSNSPANALGTPSARSDERNDNVPSTSVSSLSHTVRDGAAGQKREQVLLSENIARHGEEADNKLSNTEASQDADDAVEEEEEEINLPLTALVDFGPVAAWLLFEAAPPTDEQSSDYYQEEQAAIDQFCNSGLSLSLGQSSYTALSSKSKNTGFSVVDPFIGKSSVSSFSSRLSTSGGVPAAAPPGAAATNPRGMSSGVCVSSLSSRGGTPGSGIPLRISPYSNMGASGGAGAGRRTSSSSVVGGGGGVSSGLVQEYVSRVVNSGHTNTPEGGGPGTSRGLDGVLHNGCIMAIDGKNGASNSNQGGRKTSEHQRQLRQPSSSSSTSAPGRNGEGPGVSEREASAEEATSVKSQRRSRLTVKAFKILTFYQLTYCRRRLQQVLLRPEKHPLYQQAVRAEKRQRDRRDQLARLGDFEEEARVLPLIKLCSLLSERGIDATLVEEQMQHAKEAGDSSLASSSSMDDGDSAEVADERESQGFAAKTRGVSGSSPTANDSSAGGVVAQASGDHAFLVNSQGDAIAGDKSSSSTDPSCPSTSSSSNTPVMSRQTRKACAEVSPGSGGGGPDSSTATSTIMLSSASSPAPGIPPSVQQSAGSSNAPAAPAGGASRALLEFPGSRPVKKQRVGDSVPSPTSQSVGTTDISSAIQQQSGMMRMTGGGEGGEGLPGSVIGEQSKHSSQGTGGGINHRTAVLPAFDGGAGVGGGGDNGASVVMVGGHRWYIRPWGWERTPYADLVGGEDDFVGIQCAQFLQVSYSRVVLESQMLVLESRISVGQSSPN